MCAGGSLALRCYATITGKYGYICSLPTLRLHERMPGHAPHALAGHALEWLHWYCKDVTNATLGLDNAWRAGFGIQLASQPQDLHVDATVEYVFVHACCLQKMLACQRPQRRLEKGQ